MRSGIQDHTGQHDETLSLLKLQKYKKKIQKKKYPDVMGVLVIPATRESETGESLEPGR